MFTQKLTAWREKQRLETAWFQGKIQVEKSGGNLGHIYRVTPQQHLSPLAASSDEGGHFHCNHNIFTRFGRTQRTAPPLREQGGEPRGARWGARWGTPGSKVGSRVEERPAVHTTPQSRQSQVNPEDLLSPQSHSTYEESGAPRLPARPTSSAVCVRRQSLSLRLSQRRS